MRYETYKNLLWLERKVQELLLDEEVIWEGMSFQELLSVLETPVGYTPERYAACVHHICQGLWHRKDCPDTFYVPLDSSCTN